MGADTGHVPTLPKLPTLSEGPPIAVQTGPELDNRRIAAGLIDLAVPLAAGAVVLFVLGLSLTRGLFLVAVGWVLYYFFAFESGDGQTLGKRLMKLRVVSADGAPASMEQIAKRTVVRILDGHVVGLVVMLATGERRQRLGDIVAGTVVTDADPQAGAPYAEDRLLAGDEPLVEREDPDGEMPVMNEEELAEPVFELSDHAPTVELDHSEPSTDYDEPAPLVEVDSGPHVEIGAPVVEVEPGPVSDPAPEPAHEPLIEFDREVQVEVDADEPLDYADEPDPYEELDPSVGHEPVVEAEPPAYVEPDVEPQPAYAAEPEPEPVAYHEPDPAPEGDSAPGAEEEFTVKPVETVSAIDLVMQDAEDRRPSDR